MSTLFEKTHLIHNQSKTEFNNRIFDDLRSRFAELVSPYVAGALSEQYSDSAARTIVEEAEIVLADILSRKDAINEYNSKDAMLSELSSLLALESGPSDEEISLISKSLSTSVISTWITELHRVCKKSKERPIHSFGPLVFGTDRLDFKSALAPFPISMDTLHAVFPQLLEKLPVNHKGLIDLPLGLYLQPSETTQDDLPIYYYVGLAGKHDPTPIPELEKDHLKDNSSAHEISATVAIAREILKRKWKHLLIESCNTQRLVVLKNGIPEGSFGFFESAAEEINQSCSLFLAEDEEKYKPVQPQALEIALGTAVEHLSKKGVVMVSSNCYVSSNNNVPIMTDHADLEDRYIQSRSQVYLATMFNSTKV